MAARLRDGDVARRAGEVRGTQRAVHARATCRDRNRQRGAHPGQGAAPRVESWRSGGKATLEPAGQLAGAFDRDPAVAGSGQLLPARLVLAWGCDSRLTRQTLDLSGQVIATSHTDRTLKAHERRALLTQTGGTCQGAGCSRSTKDPGVRLHPHHADPWAKTGTTSLRSSVLLCDVTHQDLHHGHTIRLKNGRYLGPDGYADAP